MILYKAHITLRGQLDPETFSRLMSKHRIGRKKDSHFFMTETKPNAVVLCQIAVPDADHDGQMREYLAQMGVPFGKIQKEQIGISALAGALFRGSQEELCPEVQEVLGPLHMMPYVVEPFSLALMECTFPDTLTRARVERCCARIHSHALREELERIRAGAGQTFRGHPVLYSIVSESRKKNEEILGLLLSELHMAGRLRACRATTIKPYVRPLTEGVMEDVYQAQNGAAIVVDLQDVDNKNQLAMECMKAVRRFAQEERGRVLTVFMSCSDDAPALAKLKVLTQDLPVLSIGEDTMNRAEARRSLAAMAKDAGLGKVSLAGCLPEAKAEFTSQELGKLFAQWQDDYLSKTVYPQYADVLPRRAAVQKQSDSTAMDELEALVGLTEVKRIIHQAVDYARMQELCRAEGLPTQPLHLHMAFTGNPGTAKTTVARLVARIFKEYGILSKGDLVEVGRGDLIGKYVGWTAKLVQEKFRAAEGSVLFIDEAYSLLDDKENQFGDEAINAIVQEMENHRDSTVVIFAGYREPMQRFLDRNVGLRSRVSYQVDFPDYTEDELTQILQQQLLAKGRKLSPDAESKVRGLLRSGMEDSRFGNGRYARSMVENAMMAQASRLAALPREQLGRETLQMLTAEDFQEKKREVVQKRVIGFHA